MCYEKDEVSEESMRGMRGYNAAYGDATISNGAKCSRSNNLTWSMFSEVLRIKTSQRSEDSAISQCSYSKPFIK